MRNNSNKVCSEFLRMYGSEQRVSHSLDTDMKRQSNLYGSREKIFMRDPRDAHGRLPLLFCLCLILCK